MTPLQAPLPETILPLLAADTSLAHLLPPGGPDSADITPDNTPIYLSSHTVPLPSPLPPH